MPVNGNHTKRSAPMVMGRLALLVRPLAGYMALAILAGLAALWGYSRYIKSHPRVG